MENIQKRLLSLTTLSLEKALEISVAMEMVPKDAVKLQGENREVDVQQVQQDHRQNRPNLNKKKRQQTQSCFRCGDFRHSPNNCKFKNVDCHGCGKKGHIKRACLSGKLRGGRVSGSRNSRNVRNVGKFEFIILNLLINIDFATIKVEIHLSFTRLVILKEGYINIFTEVYLLKYTIINR